MSTSGKQLLQYAETSGNSPVWIGQITDLRLEPINYDHLRRTASSLLQSECRNHPFQPEDLLHEAMLRIIKSRRAIQFQSWDHFRRTATESMRRALVDYGRADKASKRWGLAIGVELKPDTLI